MMSHGGSKGSIQDAIINSASRGRVVPGGRARKSNSRVAISAPRGGVVPEGRERKSHRRVATARTGTVQKRVGRVRMYPGKFIRYWWRLYWY